MNLINEGIIYITVRVASSQSSQLKQRHLPQQITDFRADILNATKAPTTINGTALAYSIPTDTLVLRATWSQVDELTSDHIASKILLDERIPVLFFAFLSGNQYWAAFLYTQSRATNFLEP